MTHPHSKQEKKVWQIHKLPIIALDEAGRGSLAGPVTVCAFVIKKPLQIPSQMKEKTPCSIRDSKQLSPIQRQKIYAWLRNNKKFAFSTTSVSAKKIDKVNIRNANFIAMRQAVKKLSKKTGYKKFVVFIDGREPVPGLKQKQFCFPKGDAYIFSIACASIIAKVKRDRLITNLAKKFPQYCFNIHKGYGTKLHFERIKKFGLSPWHRKTFLKRLQN